MGLIIGSLFLAFFVVAIAYMVKEAEKVAKEDERKRKEEDELKAKQDEEKKRMDSAEKQKNLVIQYKTSPITQEVVKTICCVNGVTIFPEEILIFDYYIQAKSKGSVIRYDFAEHRVRPLEYVGGVFEKESEIQNIVRPQIALAQALNFLLEKKYEIYDNAKRQYKHHHFLIL